MHKATIKIQHMHRLKMKLARSSARSPSSGHRLVLRELPRALQGNVLYKPTIKITALSKKKIDS